MRAYAALQTGQLTPIDLVVEERFHRAAPGGMGGTKAAGNYSPVSSHPFIVFTTSRDWASCMQVVNPILFVGNMIFALLCDKCS